MKAEKPKMAQCCAWRKVFLRLPLKLSEWPDLRGKGLNEGARIKKPARKQPSFSRQP